MYFDTYTIVIVIVFAVHCCRGFEIMAALDCRVRVRVRDRSPHLTLVNSQLIACRYSCERAGDSFDALHVYPLLT